MKIITVKDNIKNLNIRGSISLAKQKTEYRLRRLCGKPSPIKRLIIVLLLSLFFAVVNVWFFVSTVYNIGKKDAQKEMLKLEHIEHKVLINN